MLDNVDHIKAFWIATGVDVAQIALWYGADDLDGTVQEERIYHMAGSRTPEILTVADIRRLIRAAGRTPVERDTLYRVIEREAVGDASGRIAHARLATPAPDATEACPATAAHGHLRPCGLHRPRDSRLSLDVANHRPTPRELIPGTTAGDRAAARLLFYGRTGVAHDALVRRDQTNPQVRPSSSSWRASSGRRVLSGGAPHRSRRGLSARRLRVDYAHPSSELKVTARALSVSARRRRLRAMATINKQKISTVRCRRRGHQVVTLEQLSGTPACRVHGLADSQTAASGQHGTSSRHRRNHARRLHLPSRQLQRRPAERRYPCQEHRNDETGFDLWESWITG